MSFSHSCDGVTLRYSWMDDGYSAGGGSGPCPALRGGHCEASNCPSNNKDKRRETTVPDSKVKVKISIPVTIGGYTGQRDQWEEHERDYNIAVEDGKVVMEEASLSSIGRKVTFDKESLEQALRMLGQQTPARPLYRNDTAPRTGAEAQH